MESKLEEFWEHLSNFKIQKIERITTEENSTYITCVEITETKNYISNRLADYPRLEGPYYPFNVNINRVMILFEKLLHIEESSEMDVNLEYSLICEIIIILLMSSLEVYLTDTFVRITSNFGSIATDAENIERIKDFQKKIKENNPVFQKKEDIKDAYNSLNIDLVDIIDHEIWRRIFSKGYINSHSKFCGYMKIRHDIIHNGNIVFILEDNSVKLLYPFNTQFIETAILDVVKFIYNTDLKVKNIFDI